jgi:CIC family chloride channel protein
VTHQWKGLAGGWLRGSRGGLFVLALLVGVGSGLGAVAFRYLIYFFTWLATGYGQFGQQGHVGSAHVPWLGVALFVLIPAVGGLVYGPLIYRYAREARGHGVPEVMIAVADNGGRIRPQVSLVKAVASALCIGTGGSVGREGPIVQIGSALASSLGQWVRMPENRMRILVACGAGGGIAATFNAPVTGVFFGVELILREFSVEALFTVMLSAMMADVVGEAFLGSGRFLAGFPSGIELHHPRNYLLVAVLAVAAALIGIGFQKFLYKTEDVCDRVWKHRPEWARPAVGGIALGLLLLAVPQMYGVGYPVLYRAVAGGYTLWFLLVLAAAKMAAASLTIGIGGSGGVFAPSLFVGATSGMAFGEIAGRLLGPGAGQPALYAAVAMGAVFAAAARAPLTSLASVVEMTGDYALTLPVMLAVAVATAVSRALSHGTIYTTKLLRRGTDIDRPAPAHALHNLTVADAMHRFPVPLAVPPAAQSVATGTAAGGPATHPDGWADLAGPVTYQRAPQALFAGEPLAEALRQLLVYGRDGLPVLSADGRQVQGWVTNNRVLQAVARQVDASRAEAARAQLAADWALPDPDAALRQPSTPLPGYQMLEITVQDRSPAAGIALGRIGWPAGATPAAVLRTRKMRDPDPGLTLTPGDRIILLAAEPDHHSDMAGQAVAQRAPAHDGTHPLRATGGGPAMTTFRFRALISLGPAAHDSQGRDYPSGTRAVMVRASSLARPAHRKYFEAVIERDDEPFLHHARSSPSRSPTATPGSSSRPASTSPCGTATTSEPAWSPGRSTPPAARRDRHPAATSGRHLRHVSRDGHRVAPRQWTSSRRNASVTAAKAHRPVTIRTAKSPGLTHSLIWLPLDSSLAGPSSTAPTRPASSSANDRSRRLLARAYQAMCWRSVILGYSADAAVDVHHRRRPPGQSFLAQRVGAGGRAIWRRSSTSDRSFASMNAVRIGSSPSTAPLPAEDRGQNGKPRQPRPAPFRQAWPASYTGPVPLIAVMADGSGTAASHLIPPGTDACRLWVFASLTAVDVRRLARDERADFAAFLATLSPQQWQAPTLCEQWRVRDVVAHVISYDDLGPRGLLTLAARGRFRLGRINTAALARYATSSPQQLQALLTARLQPHGVPAMLGSRVGLVETLIHHQDIRRALGRPRRIPPERLGPALRTALIAPDIAKLWPLRGVRLVATDLPFTAGAGPQVRGPAEALLMTIAGRRGVVDELSGPGQAKLARRIGG